jgi:threonine/homoserine/homoserine lactone efflux protein
MVDWTKLPLFMAAAAVLLITPGPAVLYIVGRSIDEGRLAGFISILGISFGTLFHVFAAAFGLSILITTSAFAFNIIKYLGAIYLIYLGLRNFFNKGQMFKHHKHKRQKLTSIFYEGALVNLLNPKMALFFLAFLPQFVDPSVGHVSIQILILGVLFIIMAIISDGSYALLAGSIGDWLKNNSRLLRIQKRLSSGIYISLGILTIFSGSVRSK